MADDARAKRIEELLLILDAPRPNPLASNNALTELVKMKGAAVERCVVARKHPNDAVRAGVAIVLGEIGDKRAVEPLLIALKDSQAIVRQMTALALGSFPIPQVSAALLKALDDPAPLVREGAIISLREMPDKAAALPVLERIAAGDPKMNVRAAAGALKKLQKRKW